MITAPIFDVAWPRPHLPVMEPHNGPYSLALQMSSPGISWWSIYNKLRCTHTCMKTQSISFCWLGTSQN